MAEDDSIELLPTHHQYYGFQDRLRSQPQHLPTSPEFVWFIPVHHHKFLNYLEPRQVNINYNHRTFMAFYLDRISY